MVGVGAGPLAVAGAAGTAWLYRRWRRERDRPISRLRRRARRAAAEPTWRVGGLGAALVLAALLGRALRARAGWEGLLDGAAAGLRDVTRTRRAPAVDEVRAGRGKIRFPAIHLRPVHRVGPVPSLAAARAPAGSVRPPSGRIGGAVGALLALGTAGCLAWRSLRGRGSRVGAGMTETAGEPEPGRWARGTALP
jgi:hypothetical protein